MITILKDENEYILKPSCLEFGKAFLPIFFEQKHSHEIVNRLRKIYKYRQHVYLQQSVRGFILLKKSDKLIKKLIRRRNLFNNQNSYRIKYQLLPSILFLSNKN